MGARLLEPEDSTQLQDKNDSHGTEPGDEQPVRPKAFKGGDDGQSDDDGND